MAIGRLILRFSMLLLVAAPSATFAQTVSSPPVAPAAPIATCDATSITSPPGKAWWAAERWRYPSDAAATTAYLTLVNNGQGGSPWATWYLPTPTSPVTAGVLAQPPITTLPVGTRFQMALAPGQNAQSPGGWGTFDYIATVEDVREFLAVTHGFKPNINQVVTYEVTRLLPVLIGPVGPQVDTLTCEYFPGRWSQFNMLPPWNERIDYLKVIEVRTIQ